MSWSVILKAASIIQIPCAMQFYLLCGYSRVFLVSRNSSFPYFFRRDLLERGQRLLCAIRASRNFGSERKKSPSASTLVKDNLVLYRFKWMKQLRFISRVKILHVAVVIILTWPMSLWYFSGLISLPTLVSASFGALGTTGGLVGLSFFFRRVVGEISVNERNLDITISSLSFWGNRCDRTFPLTNVVPLSDSGIDVKNAFHRLELYDCKIVYLLNLRHCKIFDEMFFSVIGLPKHQTDLMTNVVASTNCDKSKPEYLAKGK